jgi:hypothetical protein
MSNKKLLGITIATAAALAFAAAPINTAFAKGQTANVKCMGANGCKGLSACKTDANSCKGMNSCKGKGFIMTATDKKCTDVGGEVS